MDPCLQGVVSCPRNLKRMTSVEAVVGYVTHFFSHNKLASFLLLLPSLGVFVLSVRMNFALVCGIERNSFLSLVLRRIELGFRFSTMSSFWSMLYKGLGFMSDPF